MLLVLKYMGGKKILSYRFVKRPEVLSETFYGCEKVAKSFWFYLIIYSHFKESEFTEVKGMESSNLGM